MKISPDNQSTQVGAASDPPPGPASGAQRDKPLQDPGRDRGQPPAGEDVARFRQLSRGESNGKGKSKPGDEQPCMTPGQFPNAESILKAMHHLQADAPQGMSQTPQAGAGTITLESAAAAIAQRVLITDPELGRGQEVRIELKHDILPGTEIRISKDAQGLNVQLVTVNESSRAFLQNNQDGLVQHLQGRLQDPVQVTIRMEGHGPVQTSGQSAGPTSSQSSGQSAGHSFGQNAGNDPNQGRSRQQRSVYEEYEG